MKELICKCTYCKFNGEMTCLVDVLVVNLIGRCESYVIDKLKLKELGDELDE